MWKVVVLSSEPWQAADIPLRTGKDPNIFRSNLSNPRFD